MDDGTGRPGRLDQRAEMAARYEAQTRELAARMKSRDGLLEWIES